MMGKVALVTGGTRGIGAAISMALRDAGYVVVANYGGNDAAAAAFTAQTGILSVKFDVGDFDACAAAISKIESETGPIEVLINNAGVTKDGFLHKMTLEQWKAVINIDLDSLFNCTRPVISGMRDRGFGRIVNIASINGQKGQIGQVNYSAAKSGVIGFTKALAQEGAAKGITVNCVAPGYIATEMLNAMPVEALAKVKAGIPCGRLGESEEVARAVVFLVQDAGFINGATLTINGGQYITG
jgi:acetoacetyl-CoA reductase